MTRVSCRRFSAMALLCATTIVAACEKPTAPPPKPATAQLHLQASIPSTSVTQLVVTVTAADIPAPGLVFNLDVIGGAASGNISVPAGSDRLISVAAYDAAHVKTHTGSKTVSVQAGSNPTVSITLAPLAGDQPITVIFSSYTISVSPASGNVGIGGTKTLTVEVRDAIGPIGLASGDVKWATANPAVASVSASSATTAVVTGVGNGSVTIMATYNGVGASATISVP